MPEEIDPDIERESKRRLLADLESKDFKTATATKATQETEALVGLYRQTLGLPEHEEILQPEPEDYQAKPITRITHHEIKAMKVVSAREETATVRVRRSVAEAVLNAWHLLLDAFSARPDKRTKCLVEGHKCAHCGVVIAANNSAGKK